ncbi:helix-turn-helix domain-containing protein [Pediococcus pentosaceus]|uniref:Helix-turn-helix transcriptional regulator n=1 Tax=Pediococcus pentosaceus TaxID=1255 RepID=A0AB73HGS2_PEDPE|nr:helix-turn-helix transcriptional regulator [Pediococcus pentosaceus]MBF7115215.1 helix-turn-helix transcriptional regulator [Pediococcus pentosaceus]MCM6817956.1 helix-turn-helix domain-containing protein [Pediococcus pentosaceus]MDN3207298.1 helix-turn-helix transcriptional regulator [Pediococcus pentosaceus]
MNTLYLRIKELADDRGESLAQLERNLKLSNGIISTWKKGKASSDKIEKVADYFNVTTDYLLGRTSDPNPANNNMTKNQKLIAHSIDPDVTDEEREIIIGMVKEAMKFRRRL